MHQKPKKLKNVKWNKNFGCPGRISFFAFFNTYMYLVSKNISPGLREFLVNQCLVSQGVKELVHRICYTASNETHVLFVHPRNTTNSYFANSHKF